MIRRPLPQRLLAVLLVPVLLGLAPGCGSDGDTETKGPCTYTEDGSQAAKKVSPPPSTPDPGNPTTLTIATSAGDIAVALDVEQAPCTVNSFVSLAEQGFYDDTPCHRLTTEGYYVLQCGDPLGTGQGGPGYTFADELVPNDPRIQPCGDAGGTPYCTYNAGLLAMANRGPGTNGSQFFLVYGASPFAPDYTVFGEFDASGLQVLKDIAKVGIGTTNGQAPGDGAPKEPVTITSVE